MCTASMGKVYSRGLVMEGGESQEQARVASDSSVLLELAAADDLVGFKTAVEDGGLDVDGFGLWYGRRLGSKKIGLEERTPLMIASMFGSKRVLNYIIETGRVDVNRACGSDGATALHCAVTGGSVAMLEVVKLLVDASADLNCVDVKGNRPYDLIIPVLSSSFNSKRTMLELMLKGCSDSEESHDFLDQISGEMEGEKDQVVSSPTALKDGTERKEYPIDLSLPDIKNGIYGTDEFRMYIFKVKPCSRAYSHDWTECPFVHPGENARRRDPQKYHYSCVPCPEFRKGTCLQGDACEYAHGIFECWLHPAQYRTRLCKDETGCNRKVCFFAHKPEELRPLYASTGSAVPSPRSFSASASFDVSSISPLALGSPSVMIPPSPTPPMIPSGVSSSMAGSMWSNQSNLAPPTLHLPGSRLKTTVNSRDMDLEAELPGLESHCRREHQLIDELSGLSSPSAWNNTLASSAAFTGSPGDYNGDPNRLSGMKPTNLDDIFGSFDPTILSQLQEFSLDAGTAQLQSPTRIAIRQSLNQQLRSCYPSSLSSSPVRTSQLFGIDQAGAAPFLNSRSAAFAKRSQSFIDRSAVNHRSGITSPASATMMPSTLSDWGAPDGKLDWGIQKEELNKLRKSASFGFRSSGGSFGTPAASMPFPTNGHNASWVPSMVKDASMPLPTNGHDASQVRSMVMGKDLPTENSEHFNIEQQQQYHLNSGGSDMLPQWVEQFYGEHEQLVA